MAADARNSNRERNHEFSLIDTDGYHAAQFLSAPFSIQFTIVAIWLRVNG
jgi:hypothetical protein